MNTIILQYSSAAPGLSLKKTRAFMAAAEEAGLDYYIGLHYLRDWKGDVDGAVDANLTTLAKLSKERQVRDPASHFKGWYMPLEVANDGDKTYYTRVAAAFQRFEGATTKPLAIALFFNPHPNYLAPSAFAEAIRPVIGPFQIVMLQDSAGERKISDFRRELRPFYEAVSGVVREERKELWADVEGFECAAVNDDRQCNDVRLPATPEQIRDRVVEAKRHTSHIIAYDLIEFLHPQGDDVKMSAYEAFVNAVRGAAP